MSDIHFPYRPDRGERNYPGARIVLTESAAEQFGAAFPRLMASSDRHSPRLEGAVLSVDRVKVLDGQPFVRAMLHLRPAEDDDLYRFDLLVPTHHIISIESSSHVKTSDPEYSPSQLEQIDTWAKRLEEGFAEG